MRMTTKSLFFFSVFGILAQNVGCSSGPLNKHEPSEKSLAPRILVVGHRGASGYRPEHTLASYGLAIEMGADFVEPDLVSTRDGVLIARHENEIGGTTNVAQKFPSRKARKMVDGKMIEGWFTEDFSLKEIKQLKAKERLEFRDHSFDGQYEIPTFQEIIQFVKKKEKEKNRVIGIYPELKHSTHFATSGLPLERTFVDILNKNGYTQKDSPIFVQSFEVSNLKALRQMTQVKLLQLFEEPEERPYDLVVQGDLRTYGDLARPEGLKEVATYANAIGPYKRMILPEQGPEKKLGKPTSLIHDAHAVGLLVHPYTFRDDARYLAPEYHGDPLAEYLQFFELGVDGVFSDFSDTAVRARNLYYSN